jgi:magnesium-transporting ATPase (P-type)
LLQAHTLRLQEASLTGESEAVLKDTAPLPGPRPLAERSNMVFKGTADLSGDEINRRFDALGAAANAFTSEEDTVYYATVLPDRQGEAVDDQRRTGGG